MIRHLLHFHLWLLLVVFSSRGGLAMAESPDSNSLIAALNYNFAKYARWPDENTSHSIDLCYFTNGFNNGFNALKGKEIFDIPVTVKQLSMVEQVDECHLVYLDKSERDLSQRLFVHIQDRPILTVSDISGFVDDGGMIEILKVDNKFRFRVNLGQINKANLSMSSQVLKLAVEVK